MGNIVLNAGTFLILRPNNTWHHIHYTNNGSFCESRNTSAESSFLNITFFQTFSLMSDADTASWLLSSSSSSFQLMVDSVALKNMIYCFPH